MLGEMIPTDRGFERIDFKDRYGHVCSLQASSLADFAKPGTSAIWLGPNEAEPKVLASEAPALGIKTDETTGWVPYPVPANVLMTTRMHLDREQVASLIKHLQQWLDKDTFVLDE